MEKYNLDSCKFLYRVIKNINNLNNSTIFWHIGSKPTIYYGSYNIQALNIKVGYHWIGIWNSLVRDNIYIKSLLMLNELTLNLYKNMWDDKWFNKMIDKVSYNYTIIEVYTFNLFFEDFIFIFMENRHYLSFIFYFIFNFLFFLCL